MRSLQTSRLISANTTNATVVRAARGHLVGGYMYNANAAVRYLKLYDLAVAPTVGTSVPKMTIALPPAQATPLIIPGGVHFENGIAFATTTGVADSDTAAVAANEIVVNLLHA